MESQSRPILSVVVATHDRAASLSELLDGLRSQRLQADEVVVVDDGSSDGTATLLTQQEARGDLPLTVLRREPAAGPATARDAGWRAARGDLIAFTDDDCVPDPGWLEELATAWAGASDRFVQGHTEPPSGAHVGPFSRTIRVTALDPAFHTCNIAYPRPLLERIDGFDTETFGRQPGGEDCDLGWRAIQAGATPTFAPEALVRHAVNDLGPIGKLKVAARWATPLRAYAMHPELRRAQFRYGLFWKTTHLWLFRALLATTLPRTAPVWTLPLRLWLAYPYVRNVWARGRVEGGGALLAPYFVLHDLVETWAVLRAAVRTRTPML